MDSAETIDDKSKKRKILTAQLTKDNKVRLYNGLKKKLKDIIPQVFDKDIERGEYIFNLFCDIIRINNFIDTHNDMTTVEFLITEQRILRALDNFFSIKRELVSDVTEAANAKILKSYMTPYNEQFQNEIEIGAGAYGKVYKTQHRLDETWYAVKKIFIPVDEVKMILESVGEVKVLAKLNHPNIISYKQAWIEPHTNNDNLGVSESASASLSSRQISKYLSNICHDTEFFKSISKGKSKSLVIDPDQLNEECSKKKKSKIILYIQMSLSGNNLRQWLDKRNADSPASEIERIVKGILRGLNYIHNCGIIHHDINPNNIFLDNDDDLHIRIGDFGFACFEGKLTHSSEFGTFVYAAPEQLEKKCTPKSDIYSFGVITFELINRMRTMTELIEELKKLKSGEIVGNLHITHPTMVNIIKNCLDENPDQRLSAEEILELFKKGDKDRILELEKQNAFLIEEINRLRNEKKDK